MRPDIARATLRAHAALQGVRDDPDTDEEPGKIVHEYRPDADERFAYMGLALRDGVLRYYGSADGTSWFLVLLAALGDGSLARELEPAWRAAGGWLERALERGGGFVTHGPRRAPGGLVQQGWRDAVDPLAPHGPGILHRGGSVPPPPLADADTQAVALVALRALALLAGEERWRELAERTARLVEITFLPETMAFEANSGRMVLGAGSQLGWLLWSCALSPAAADRLAERLCRPDILTPFGLRTLADSEDQFDPGSYHRGGVWPFDCWLGWGGLRAAGRDTEAETVRAGVLEALERLGHAPELYAVGPDGPSRIPISNQVQAWTVGARWALRERWDGRPKALFSG